ncbi:MAG: hypothetical protein WA324_26480 [Bryobacteraceae bacterium]
MRSRLDDQVSSIRALLSGMQQRGIAGLPGIKLTIMSRFEDAGVDKSRPLPPVAPVEFVLN